MTRSYNRTIHHQTIHSNIPIVGNERWTETNKVKTVTFSVNNTLDLLRNQEKIKALGNPGLPSEEQLKLFERTAKSMTIKAWYGCTYGGDFDAPMEIWPVYTIEYDEPQSIHDYLFQVLNCVNFLSFCFGVKLVPHDIHIDQLSHTEIRKALEEKNYQGDYEVHYIWPETKIDLRDLWVGGSPVRAWNDKELNTLCACLVAWMDRADIWKKSYIMMMRSFGLKESISAERLINACRWFEEVPIASANKVISRKDICAIVNAAKNMAKELGHPSAIRERIANAISKVKEESTEEHFTRLVKIIEEKFGKDIFPKNAVSHLRQAIQFRGKTAHGHFNPKNDDEFRAFNKSTLAMEALCYLLTALELPISEEGMKRVRHNPLVRDYHNAYE